MFKKVDIFTKRYCPYCSRAKALLDSLEVPYEDHDITDTPEKIEELSKKSGIRTVPQIFADGEFVGDCITIEALNEDGKLLEKLKA